MVRVDNVVGLAPAPDKPTPPPTPTPTDTLALAERPSPPDPDGTRGGTERDPLGVESTTGRETEPVRPPTIEETGSVGRALVKPSPGVVVVGALFTGVKALELNVAGYDDGVLVMVTVEPAALTETIRFPTRMTVSASAEPAPTGPSSLMKVHVPRLSVTAIQPARLEHWLLQLMIAGAPPARACLASR